MNKVCIYNYTDYLHPVVKQLETVSKLTVRSQVLYMTGLSVSPQWSKAHQHYALPENQLPLTINAIEAKLGKPNLCFPIYSNFTLQRKIYSNFFILYTYIYVSNVIRVFPRCAYYFLSRLLCFN